MAGKKRVTDHCTFQYYGNVRSVAIESKKIAMGAFGRRLKAKRGLGIAVKPTARKLAVLYWRLMVKGLDYTEKGTRDYEEKMNLQKKRWSMKTVNEMGHQLVVGEQVIQIRHR